MTQAKKPPPRTGKGSCLRARHVRSPKETKSCQNAVIVTKDGKKETYYLVHEGISKKSARQLGFCQASKDNPVKVKITGTVEKKDDGKLHFTATKIEKE